MQNFSDGFKSDFEATAYESAVHSSWIGDELKVVRNSHASFRWGLLAGMVHTAFSCFISGDLYRYLCSRVISSGGKEPWTIHNKVEDSALTKKARECKEIEYPKPDGILSFDLLSNLQRSGTIHDHDQPSHLRVKEGMENIPLTVSLKDFDGPEQRFCPAGLLIMIVLIQINFFKGSTNMPSQMTRVEGVWS